MILRVLFTVLSCSAPFIVISNNVPSCASAMAWIYIALMMVVGVMTWKADAISAWCDKQLAKKKDNNGV